MSDNNKYDIDLKQSLRILKTGIFLITLLTLSHCQKDELIPEAQSAIATVSFEEAIAVLGANDPLVSNKSSVVPFVTSDLESIYHEPLTDSDESMTIIPATNRYDGVYSRILLLKINGSIEHLVFSMVTDEASETTAFSGKIYLTTLEGDYINAYKLVDGIVVSRYKKPEDKTTEGVYARMVEEPCWGIACGMEGDEIIIDARTGGGDMNHLPIVWLFLPTESSPYGGGGMEPDVGIGWNFGGGGGSSSVPCSSGYVKDAYGNCVVVDVVGPSCRAFEYSNIANTNWQASATKNIVALIGYYDIATGNFDTANVLFPQAIYFQMPINSPANDGYISPGRAAELTALALKTAIERAKYYFLSTSASSSQVQSKLWEYLRDEMNNGAHIVGGKASFTPPYGFTGQIKDYKSYWFLPDNCD